MVSCAYSLFMPYWACIADGTAAMLSRRCGVRCLESGVTNDTIMEPLWGAIMEPLNGALNAQKVVRIMGV